VILLYSTTWWHWGHGGNSRPACMVIVQCAQSALNSPDSVAACPVFGMAHPCQQPIEPPPPRRMSGYDLVQP
jgi:hypothetical protein